MRAERPLVALTLACAAAAQDLGQMVTFGSAPRAHFAVKAGAAPAQPLFDGLSDPLTEAWDTVLLQGVLPDPGVSLRAQRAGAPGWTELELRRSPDGRFWARASLARGSGQLWLQALDRGVAFDHEVMIFGVTAFQSGPPPIPAPAPPPSRGPMDPTAPRPPFHPRADWNAAPPTEPYSPDPLPWRITLHHSDGRYTRTLAASLAEARFIQDLHQNGRGWGDIGYHFLIDAAGHVIEGRPLGALGAHTLSNNEGNVGIAFLGSYHPRVNDTPTPEQLAKTKELGRYLVRAFGIHPGSLKGHRDYKATDCPGDRLHVKLAELRDGFAGRIAWMELGAPDWDAQMAIRAARPSVTR